MTKNKPERQRNEIAKQALKTITTSAAISAAAAAAGVIYGLITLGRLSSFHLFRFAFAAGAFIIAAGIVLLILPARVRNRKLLDFESLMEAREKKRAEAYYLLYVGLGCVGLTAIVEFIVSLI